MVPPSFKGWLHPICRVKYKGILQKSNEIISMKHSSYYETLDVTHPDKTKYTKCFFYKKGKLIATKVWGEGYDDLDVEVPLGAVEEQVFDEVSYNQHLDLYRSRVKEKQEEFKNDLLDKYEFLEHPKADKIFLLAWQAGSGKYSDVEMYFSDFLGLFDCFNSESLDAITFNLNL